MAADADDKYTTHVDYEPSLEDRKDARSLLMATEEGRRFCRLTEREQRDDEAEEPDYVPNRYDR